MVPEGDVYQAYCHITANPAFTLTWYHDGLLVDASARHAIMTSLTMSSLVITDVVLDDAGTYTCTASNIPGQASASNILDVMSMYYTCTCMSGVE